MPFSKLGLHATLVAATRKLHYTEPTPIQAEAIPAVLAGRDVIATAQTGTGKTAAFLLPICHGLLNEPRGPAALIITPTRELAQQIESVCKDLTQSAKLRVGLVVGGASMDRQERILRGGVDLLIATTGRLLDHLRYQPTALNRIGVLVLDEADRMFDMGFLPDIRRLIGKMPSRKQTLLFSATMPPVIATLAREILKNPASIQIGRKTAVAVGITQAAYPVADHLKTALLRHLLRETEMPSVLVFTRTKHSAKKLTRVIAEDGFTVAELHSNRTQAQRTKAMEGFRRGAYQVLVATNIAARGLDVDHITHVISYDVPHVPEDYIHRIGRTARAKAEGDAFVLVSPPEEGCLSQIERQIGQRLPRVTLPEFDYKQAPSDRNPREPRESRGARGSGAPQRRTRPAGPPRGQAQPGGNQDRRRR
jgi:ATP-dependent RNA helicase RhlE